MGRKISLNRKETTFNGMTLCEYLWWDNDDKLFGKYLKFGGKQMISTRIKGVGMVLQVLLAGILTGEENVIGNRICNDEFAHESCACLWRRQGHEINGYYVFVAEKRILSKKDKDKTTNNLSKKLQRKQQRNKIHRKGA